ncbi:MAG: hypothetical protein NTX79_00065 [Candidatus Micrarchaeota archaeon]|nr:hypothetical protein [Candidatus Micrarchaeota archaeon]
MAYLSAKQAIAGILLAGTLAIAGSNRPGHVGVPLNMGQQDTHDVRMPYDKAKKDTAAMEFFRRLAENTSINPKLLPTKEFVRSLSKISKIEFEAVNLDGFRMEPPGKAGIAECEISRIDAVLARADSIPCSILPFETWGQFLRSNIRKVRMDGKARLGATRMNSKTGTLIINPIWEMMSLSISGQDAAGLETAFTLVHEAGHRWTYRIGIRPRVVMGENGRLYAELQAVHFELVFAKDLLRHGASEDEKKGILKELEDNWVYLYQTRIGHWNGY